MQFFETYFGLHMPSSHLDNLDATKDLANHCSTFVLAFKKLFRSDENNKSTTNFVSNNIDFNYLIEVLKKLISHENITDEHQ
jgi:hypothetical protein